MCSEKVVLKVIAVVDSVEQDVAEDGMWKRMDEG